MSGRPPYGPYVPNTCAVGLSVEELAAWRDGLLLAPERQRLERHLPTCRACQAQLDAFDRVARTLRSRRPPDMQEEVWRGVQRQMGNGGRSTRRLRGRSMRGPLIAATAAALVVALFAGMLITHGGHGGPPGSGSTPTSSPARTTTATPASGIPAGWTTAPIGWGVGAGIGLAPTDPSTAYGCIVASSGQLMVGVTHDAGASWTSVGTPLQGNRCLVSVDPLNPEDVVLNNGNSYGIQMVRSFDGGKHWQPQTGATLTFVAGGWVDSSLYVVTTLADSGGSAMSHLYVSRNGGAFTELDQNGMLGGFSLANAAVRFVTGYDPTILLAGGNTGLLSTDGGQTWSELTFKDGVNAVSALTTSPDGQRLIGVSGAVPNRPAISSDWGRTWQGLPAAPASVPGFESLWMAPDGTLYATSTNLNSASEEDRNLYTLAPGGTQWAVAFQLPQNVFPDAVGWDLSERPTTLWATYVSDRQGSSWTLISHALK